MQPGACKSATVSDNAAYAPPAPWDAERMDPSADASEDPAGSGDEKAPRGTHHVAQQQARGTEIRI